ncbi:hypothetical protein BZA05DRAFT_401161, partial [Tricharina praecox]|uniref:uncharacterized protein n=1 Tax=Tricharina praecox TaxID=43433 RepID=UPI00221F423B
DPVGPIAVLEKPHGLTFLETVSVQLTIGVKQRLLWMCTLVVPAERAKLCRRIISPSYTCYKLNQLGSCNSKLGGAIAIPLRVRCAMISHIEAMQDIAPENNTSPAATAAAVKPSVVLHGRPQDDINCYEAGSFIAFLAFTLLMFILCYSMILDHELRVRMPSAPLGSYVGPH